MIITKPGKYQIQPITQYNKIGNPYQVREVEITEVDKVNQKVYCPELGWIDWDLPVKEEKRGRKNEN
jgi:hypothetical protein